MNNNELRKNNREVIDLKTTAYIILEQLYHRANTLEERKYIKWHYNRYIKLLELIFEHSKKFFNTLQETIKYLDVGIGYGHISIILNKILKWDFFGIDKMLVDERFEREKIHFRLADLEQVGIPFENDFFDIVVATEVIEHLLIPPKDLFKEIFRVLKSGGVTIISTPNYATLYNRLKLLVGKNPLEPFYVEKNTIRGHIREYTINELKDSINYANLKIVEISFNNCWEESRTKVSQKYGGKRHHLYRLFRPLFSLFPTLKDNITIVAKKQ